MEFRPCIDLHKGMVKQIVGASLTDDESTLVENFSTNAPVSGFVERYKHDNLRGGHIIKLGEGNDDSAKSALEQWKDAFQIGGGINDENAKTWIDCGASHVIVTSFVFKDARINIENLQKLYKAVGKERITLDLSCKKQDGEYYIVTDRWQKFTSETICAKTLDFLSRYCGEFLVHAADVEGKKQGADLELVDILAKCASVPTTYAGGISTLDDIKDIKTHGCARINFTVGSALDIFGGKLSYNEVVEFCRQK